MTFTESTSAITRIAQLQGHLLDHTGHVARGQNPRRRPYRPGRDSAVACVGRLEASRHGWPLEAEPLMNAPAAWSLDDAPEAHEDFCDVCDAPGHTLANCLQPDNGGPF